MNGFRIVRENTRNGKLAKITSSCEATMRDIYSSSLREEKYSSKKEMENLNENHPQRKFHLAQDIYGNHIECALCVFHRTECI